MTRLRQLEGKGSAAIAEIYRSLGLFRLRTRRRRYIYPVNRNPVNRNPGLYMPRR